MICRNCGRGLPEDAVFCPTCGTPVLRGIDGEPQDDPYAYRQDTQNYDYTYRGTSTPVKEDRNFWVFLLLSLVTCGIYGVVFMYRMTEDVNKVCADDGQETPNYVVMLLLSLVTCGIYGFIWYYNLGNRMRGYAFSRYGQILTSGGTEILLLLVFGGFTGSVTAAIAHYFLIQNMNRLAALYNSRA